MIIGIAFIFISLVISLMYPLLAIFLILLGILILSTHYRLAVDLEQKTYREYLWILGMKQGEVTPFEDLQEIRVRLITQKITYGVVSRVNGRKQVYTADLILDNQENLYLGEHSNEQKLMKKLDKVKEQLSIPIYKTYDE